MLRRKGVVVSGSNSVTFIGSGTTNSLAGSRPERANVKTLNCDGTQSWCVASRHATSRHVTAQWSGWLILI